MIDHLMSYSPFLFCYFYGHKKVKAGVTKILFLCIFILYIILYSKNPSEIYLGKYTFNRLENARCSLPILFFLIKRAGLRIRWCKNECVGYTIVLENHTGDSESKKSKHTKNDAQNT